jgi:translation initiation factor 1
MSKSRLVYSTDPRDNVVCPKCRKKAFECRCIREDAVEINKVMAVFRLEKNGRGGKIVTVLDQLPRNDQFLKDLTKELKNKCGTGGTYVISDKSGLVEIQGDKREQIKKILEAKGIKFKGM